MKEANDCDPLLNLIEQYKSMTDLHDVFGLILYTDEHPYVVKILRDNDFWKALDTKSGKRWVIFSIRPEIGESETRFSGGSGRYMEMIRAIPQWHEPAQNLKLLSLLELGSTQKLPILLVFAQPKGGDLLRVVFKISGASLAETYSSLERAVTTASDAIENVTPENIKNTLEVFNLVEGAANQQVVLQRFKSASSLIPYVEKLFKVLGGK